MERWWKERVVYQIYPRSFQARNHTENRLAHKASKRDIAFSEACILREDAKYRLVSNEGEIPFKHYTKIDNTNIESGVVAQKIKEFFVCCELFGHCGGIL